MIEPTEGDERRRPYRITSAGRAALATAVREMRTIADEGAERLGLAAPVRQLDLTDSGRSLGGRNEDGSVRTTPQVVPLGLARARYGRGTRCPDGGHLRRGRYPLSSRLAIMRTGAAEHLREIGLGGGEETPAERVRSGSLLVLCGWALFVIAGSAFAKMTEHWVGTTPPGDRALPTNAYDAVQVAASVGLVIVIVAAQRSRFPPSRSFFATGVGPGSADQSCEH